VQHAVDTARASGRPIGDFEINVCGSDMPAALPNPAISLIYDGKRGGLAFSSIEHDSPLNGTIISIDEVMRWRDNHPWSGRTAKAVFRGGRRTCHPDHPAGDVFADEAANPIEEDHPSYAGLAEHYRNNRPYRCGRAQLVHLANDVDAWCMFDVRFASKHVYMSMPDQEQYKYIIYAEGHGGWANRLASLLAMGSAVIMQTNCCSRQWYSWGLKPWVHYIPVDHLWNNLATVVQWARHNDKAVQHITANADAYARAVLSHDSVLLFQQMLLRRLADLYRYEITVDPKALDVEALEEAVSLMAKEEPFEPIGRHWEWMHWEEPDAREEEFETVPRDEPTWWTWKYWRSP
jgi:hypothetical protein